MIKDISPITPWATKKKWLEERIEKHREALEMPACGERAGDVLRGRIAEIKAIIKAVEKMEREKPDYGDSALSPL